MFTMKRATKAYAAASPAICKKFGGRYLLRNGRFSDMEGQSRSRNVVVEFPDYESALACCRSARRHSQRTSIGRTARPEWNAVSLCAPNQIVATVAEQLVDRL
jgi:uncharacterized protein (DUF1330 family)